MSRIANIMRTTAMRLSALYIILFGLVAVGLSIYMTKLSITMLANQTEQTLSEELANIGQAYDRGGIPLLMRTIDHRSRQPGAFLYLVTDASGRILAGNVANISLNLIKDNNAIKGMFNYYRFDDTGERKEHHAIASLIDLPNGMKLLVGRDMGEPERFVGIIQKAMMIALATMALGALIIWFFVGRRALQRIDRVTAASQKLMDGDLSGRLPVTKAGDEFDRLSTNLNIMLDRIEELNIGLHQVSDNIAHDLKTPLTRLRNRAEEALSGTKKPLEYRQALDGVITESDQLIRTFNAILMISRLEASSTIEHLTMHNLRTIVEDAGELYEPVAEESGIELVLGEMLDAELKINRELVAQTIFNLIDNALKYAGSENNKAKVLLSMEEKENKILIIISDNGVGIAAKDRERAMERFVRLDESRTQPGFGIGLSLAKAVMKLHNGQLILDNANPGLKAILSFPKLV